MPDAHSTHAPTLAVLAGLDVDASGSGLTANDRAKMLTALRDHARSFRALQASDLGESLLEFLAGSLRKPVQDIVSQVWRQRKELRDAAAKGDAAEDVEADVELIDHHMDWKLEPTVKLELDGVAVGELPFDVAVGLELKGVQIVVKNACITRVKAGTLMSTINLSCKGFPLMAPAKKSIDIKGAFDLPAGGIDLRPRDKHDDANE